MEQIVVQRKNGERLYLNSYDNNSKVTSAEQVWELTGEDALNINVTSAVALPFSIGDVIEVFGRIYELNSVPPLVKDSDREFEYQLKFEGVQYKLIKVQFLDYDATNVSTGSTFDLMCNVQTVAELIVLNANRVYGTGTWILGEYPQGTDFSSKTFQNQNCLDVITTLCTDNKVNYDIERLPTNKFRLNIRVPNRELEPVFRYGRAKGLYKLSRRNISDANIITRVFAFGGTQNVPPNYRGGSDRIKLPIAYIPSEGEAYIQDPGAIEKYGIIEASVTYDEIYPQRLGTVSAIEQTVYPGSELVFFDSSMDFDLNATAGGQTTYLIPGVTAKVSFLTGNLAGYEFNISGYQDGTKKFTLNTYTDSNGTVFPSASSSAFQIQPGDTYRILNISMPQSYVDNAENKLLELAVEYINANNRPRVGYDLNIAEAFVESFAPNPTEIINFFIPGDSIKVFDSDLGFDGTSTIQTITRDILHHYYYNLQLSEEKPRKGVYGEYLAQKKIRPDYIGGKFLFQETNLTPQQISQILNLISVTTTISSGGITPPIIIAPQTIKIILGDSIEIDGYIHLPVPTDPDLTLTIPDLPGKEIVGMIHIDNVPMEISASGIIYDQGLGALKLLSLGALYEGQKIVIVCL